jgi:hypothetical protein
VLTGRVVPDILIGMMFPVRHCPLP